jgi:hypothetical protein
MRVDTTGLPADNWHHFLRLRELATGIAGIAV